MAATAVPAPHPVGRYVLFDAIASGGMAQVHYGRMLGAVGFSRTVAVKRLHPHLARDPDFVKMFVDEARLAARIHHPNVVSTLDVVSEGEELFVVMDYIAGESLADLVKRVGALPPPIAVGVVTQALQGLHAAHEATTESGAPLGIVHRDISPQNIIVGGDGVARVLDFGVAKAASRLYETKEGQVKGKLSYMPPEQLERGHVDRRADIYAMGCVLWELLTGKRLFREDNPGAVLMAILKAEVERASRYAAVLPIVDDILTRALDRDAAARFATARDMARALESAMGTASQSEISTWIREVAGDALDARAARVAEIERTAAKGPAPASGVAAIDPAQRKMRAQAETLRFEDSAAIEAPRPAVPKRGRAVAVVLAGSLLVGGLVVFLVVRVMRRPTTTVTEDVVTATATTTATTAPSARPPEPAPAPSSTEPAPKPSATARRAPGPCNPPFVIDAKGIKRFKPQCL